MPEHDHRTWATQASTPAEARAFVLELCARWALGSIADDLTLMASELVTNALVHAQTEITVSMSYADGTVRLAVEDHNPQQPVLRPPRQDLLADLDMIGRLADRIDAFDADQRHRLMHYGESGSVAAGRGLAIVDAVADKWGWTPHEDGKIVWAERKVSGRSRDPGA